MTRRQVEFSQTSLDWLAYARSDERIHVFYALSGIGPRTNGTRRDDRPSLTVLQVNPERTHTRLQLAAWTPADDVICVLDIGRPGDFDLVLMEEQIWLLHSAHADRLSGWGFALDEVGDGEYFDRLVVAWLSVSGRKFVPRRPYGLRSGTRIGARFQPHCVANCPVPASGSLVPGWAAATGPHQYGHGIGGVLLPDASADAAFFFGSRTPVHVPELSGGRARAPSLFDRV